MPTVISLRRHSPIKIKNSMKHIISIRVTDHYYPEESRYDAQRPVQNAGSFRALSGFNDACARSGRWHRFPVAHKLVPRFARQIEPYVARGQVEVRIDGKTMSLLKKAG